MFELRFSASLETSELGLGSGCSVAQPKSCETWQNALEKP